MEDRRLLTASLSDLPANDSVYLLPQVRLANSGAYLSEPSEAEPLDVALDFIRSHTEDLGVTPSDVANLTVTDCYADSSTGMTYVYVRQEWNGLEISNANLSVSVTDAGQVLSVGGGFVSGLEGMGLLNRFQVSTIPAAEAVCAAADDLGIADDATPVAVAGPATADNAGELMFRDADVSLDVIPANQYYVAAADGVHLAWDVVMRTPDGEHWYDASVDAQTGETLRASDWVDEASYTVYATPLEDPDDGSRTVETDPYDTEASPYGWHDTDGAAGAEYTDTRGNNVSAQEDTDANNSGGTRPDGGASLTFDYTINFAQAPSTYQSAAVTNLFYWNNLLHDVHYQYGFTEVAGNFQETNYTGLGEGDDPVQADAQDGSGMNNANFATPPDGQSPRMQMFLFNMTTPYRDGDLDNVIVIHEYGHGVSNRVVGGPSNVDALDGIQSGGMGEGWSDWWSLMFTQKATDAKTDSYPVGTYVLGEPQDGDGIRRYPYSYDMSIDPLTYDSYNGGYPNYEVHNSGEIWCSVLWDMNWLLIDKYGFSEDIASGYTGTGSAGNVLALQLVMDSLKLMPTNPTFLDGRDALLQADQILTGGANAKEIWTAFARRGMGYSAYDGGSANSIAVTAATDLPPLAASGYAPLGVSLTPVTSVTVHFNADMDTDSFSAADDVVSFTSPSSEDLRSQITGYTWVDSTTLQIDFTTVTSDGQYTLILGPQILGESTSPLDQDYDGTAGETVDDRYTITFRYDSAVMSVTSSTPAEGSTASLPLAEITLNFSEAYSLSSADTGDLVLSEGTVTGLTLVDADTICYAVSGITTETSFTFSMAAGAMLDLVGNPGNAYTCTFMLDVGTVAFPTPLDAVSPKGSLVYQGSTSNTMSGSSDSDSFTIDLIAGQSITLLDVPSAGLQPVLEIRGPSGTLLGSVTADTAGGEAVLQTVVAPSSGQYTITVRDAGSAAGSYTLTVYLSAALEAESHGGAANDSAATAQDLDAGFATLGSASEHTAVLGTNESGTTDYYRFSLVAGQSVSLQLAAETATDAALELCDSLGNLIALPQSAVGGAQLIENFIASTPRTFLAHVTGSGTSYSLLVTLDASIDRERNDDLDTAQSIGPVDAVVGYLRSPAPAESSGAIQAETTVPVSLADEEADYVAGELIVRFADSVTTAAQESLAAALGGSIITRLSIIHGAVVRLDDDQASLADAVTAWESDPNVLYAEPNYILTALETYPDDPGFSLLYGMHNTGQTGGTADADIDAPEAWDISTGSSNVVIASIDTGVNYTHEDLAANMWTNPGEVAGDGIDNDGNGYIDDVYGMDAYNGDSDPMDDNSHGSHTSGTMAGVGNNGIGVAGVNWTARIMALKFLGAGGSGSTAGAVACVEYMTMMKTTYGVNVVVSNNSWGGGGYSEALYDAIAASNEAGILFCAAAGNAANNNDAYAYYPTNYELDGIISVAATDDDDLLASFSNYGATTVDLAAPGVNTYSTILGNSYGTKSGTSMATPHVAGAVALLAAMDPTATAAQLKAAILNGTDPIASMTGKCITGGRLNLARSLELISDPGDYYQVEVSAGDLLTTRTSTPGGTLSSIGNTLDPKIELYSPTGTLLSGNDNGAADGRNALLTYTAAEGGTYTVRVLSMVGRGEYVLEVDGATGAAAQFSVTETEPALGSRLREVSQWTIAFNDAIRLSSVEAADLTVDGVAATAVSVVDDRTLTFTLPGGLADGLHTLAIAQGAIEDLQQTAISAFTGQFTLDTTPPRVENSSIQEGDTLTSSDLTITVAFNEAMVAANLDASDIRLLGIYQNWSYTPTAYGFDTADTTLTVTYADLPDDGYALTLRSGDGRFEDLVGIHLDGEPVAWPIGTNLSGDGVEGGDFVVNFTVHAWGTNHAPKALDDVYSVMAYGLLNTAAPGLLANDTDADANTLSAVLVTEPQHGTLALASDGSFTYTPDEGYFGADEFTYRANDGAVSSIQPATVRIHVTPASLVADLQTAVGDSSPGTIVNVDGLGFFTATDALHGTELWCSDGTSNGTYLVKDIYPGPTSASVSNLVEFNGLLYFAANNSTNGTELWCSDGTEAGTVMAKDVYSGSSASSPSYLTNVGGTLFFAAYNYTNGTELWRSDGTSAGTSLVTDLTPGTNHSYPQMLTNVAGTLYFTATDTTNGREPWRSDGTASGTVLLKDIYSGTSNSTPANLSAVGSTLFFQATNGTNGIELWASDGTSDGTRMLKDINSGSGNSNPSNMAAVGSVLFFNATNGTSGVELWKTDGTEAGTVMIKDIYSGSSSSNPAYLTNVGGTLFFSANNGTIGHELWRSDGTESGTVLVKNIYASSSSYPQSLVNVNGTLFFIANNGTNGVELWKSDGTDSGTSLVADISAGANSSSPLYLSNVGGLLLFSATQPATGRELWRSDGTAPRTLLVKDIRAGTADNSISYIAEVNGVAYFNATNIANGNELWKTDGTAAGTSLVKDIYSGTGSSSPSNLTNVGGTLFFSAINSTNGYELWKSDGTDSGTVMVKDIYSGSTSSSPAYLTNVNGTLFFTAANSTNGTELWKSDGTESGTVLVKDIYSGTTSSSILYLTNVGGTLFFRATDGTNGLELWTSDGTESGTVMVKDIYSGTSSSSVYYLTAMGNTLFFQATNGTNGVELWKSDGTESGTVMVKDIYSSGSSSPVYLANVGGTLFFQAYDSTNGYELWKSDGTESGTVLVKDIYSGTTGSSPSTLTNVGGMLFFQAVGGTSGSELWKSDGTSVGTVLVKDIRSGSSSSSIRSITNVAGTAYFVANNGTSGNELWRSDGTEAGTTLCDLALGSEMSEPQVLTTAGGMLLFTAMDAAAGRELWVVPEAPRVVSLDLADASPSAAGTVRYTITFNETVTGVDATDFTLETEGLTGVSVAGVSGSGSVYTVTLSTGSGSGTVRLCVADNDSIVDVEGNALGGPGPANGAFTAGPWYSLDRQPPTATLLSVLPNPRSTALQQIDIFFDEWIVGLDATDLELTRDGGDNLLTDVESVWTIGGGTWFLGNLADLTASPGIYTLRIIASSAGITDALGNAMTTDAVLTWTTLDHTPPMALDDGYSISSGATLTVTTPGVLANDKCAAGFSLFVDVLATGVSHGTLTLSVHGAVQYAPDAGFVGTDTFTYMASDGTALVTATVWLRVGAALPVEETNAVAASADVTTWASVGSLMFFVANDGVHGAELWRTDGTTAGTAMVKDIYPGTTTSSPMNLTNLNGVLFFVADNGTSGRELWTSDGTEEGTVMLKDIYSGSTGSYPNYLVNFNGALYFEALNSTNGYELWTSDGTSDGTVMLKDIYSGGSSSYPIYLTVAGDLLFFQATNSTNGYELWACDGTSDGTVMVKDIYSGSVGSYPYGLTNVGGTLFFRATNGTDGYELWTSDGTADGTYMVKDICSGTNSSSPIYMTAVGNTLFFQANNGTNGYELWTSDGTESGTCMVKDIWSGANGSAPNYLTNLNGILFFNATNGTSGYELWTSDGTESGTVMVKEIYSGSSSSSPAYLTNLNGILFFAASTSANGRELWKSDGTESGTVMVADLNSGSNSSSPAYFAVGSGLLYFTAMDSLRGTEIWRSDGTAGGTGLIRDIRTGTADATPAFLVNAAGTLYYRATNGTSGLEIWRSDGTDATTYMVKDIYSGSGSSSPANLACAGGNVFFQAYTSANATELWVTNGTSAGTTLVKDIYSGSSSSYPTGLTAVGSRVFFQATNSTNGYELWTSDGTDADTYLVKDIYSGSGSSYPLYLTNVNGTLFFRATDATNGSELWMSDGTESGTVMVKDIYSGTGSCSPTYLTNVNGVLFFNAVSSSVGYELWRSDGTTAGTYLVKDIASGSTSSNPAYLTNVNGTMFFQAYDTTNGYELWKSDGTAAGTVPVTNIYSGSSSSSPANLTNVNGVLYFTANDGTHGVELWRSDGTAAGTLLVKDIVAGSASAGLQNLTAVGLAVYFRADDGVHGAELWRSDGTESGTAMVSDIGLDALGSDPVSLAEVNGCLFFSALDGYGGRELWVIDEPPAVSSISLLDSTLSNATTVRFTVAFTKTVTGVDASDFSLLLGGPGATIASVTGSDRTYLVTVNTGTGDGTIGLSLVDNDSIQDSLANPLCGSGAGNGSFLCTEVYTIDKTGPSGQIGQVTPNPRASAVDQVTIVFGEAISGFELADLQLTRDGGANLLGSSQTLTTADNITWTLGNLATLTDWTGTYVLTVAAGGVADSLGNASASALTMTWAATVNHAPVLDNSGTMTLAATNENDFDTAGTLVSAIVASAGGNPIADPDSDAVEGIAVTRVDSAHGTWQYKIGEAGTWTAFGTPSVTAARLLASDAATWIRFVPDADWSGTVTEGISFCAWDQSEGTAAATADTTANGDHTAFSTTSATASIVVNHVNLSPVLDALVDSSDPVELGRTFTLTASGVTDPNPAGWVVSVAFYRESNGTAGLQTGTDGDTLVGSDTDSADGWSLSVVTDGLAAGTYTYYALATDNEGALSPVGSSAVAITNSVRITYNLDVDGNGAVDALTDGVLILRYLFDPSGTWNYADALGSGATRTTRTAIRTYLDNATSTVLDVDGNGAADALTDGILILRYLFDQSGSWNYSDALGTGATRTTRAAIKAYLDQYLPAAGSSGTLEASAGGGESLLAEETDPDTGLQAVDAILERWDL